MYDVARNAYTQSAFFYCYEFNNKKLFIVQKSFDKMLKVGIVVKTWASEAGKLYKNLQASTGFLPNEYAIFMVYFDKVFFQRDSHNKQLSVMLANIWRKIVSP